MVDREQDGWTVLAQLEAALIAELRRANSQAKHTERVFCRHPLASNQEFGDMLRARGVQQGVGIVLDVFNEVMRHA